ncbi:Retrovirus-related Pol poly from transposon TNT 1-94 [Olea europaea subsp. europaea]|uniref:Retrovirus-related Pol poly from transposon TNT 1-94 n=1 Tax=Olea europaea subsp. europaea TaxID=158383 RepID=A0A8S0U2C0_OLEEU|nr:Retrovirus-related Pol poly from transposon TNT 1-94 [Olea europaea subsp. europaea]
MGRRTSKSWMILACSAYTYTKSTWIIDTGATDHIVCFVQQLTTITATINGNVKLSNGHVAVVTHIRTVQLSSDLTLTNVLCVPCFTFDLISASKLVSVLHCCLIFIFAYCFIQDLLFWKTIGIGKIDGGLYHLQLQPSQQQHHTSLSNTFEPTANTAYNHSFDLWHNRLGHVPSSRISIINKIVPEVLSESNFRCTVCPLAKQHVLPFPISTHVSSSIFELIHVLWGPFHYPSIDGFKYFVTIVDDYCRTTWTFLINNKSQTRNIITSFYNLILTQFNTKIRKIRSNNGPKFHMADFYQSKGIIH